MKNEKHEIYFTTKINHCCQHILHEQIKHVKFTTWNFHVLRYNIKEVKQWSLTVVLTIDHWNFLRLCPSLRHPPDWHPGVPLTLSRATRHLSKGNVKRFFDPPTCAKTLKHFFVTTMNRLTVNSPSSCDPTVTMQTMYLPLPCAKYIENNDEGSAACIFGCKTAADF